MLPSFAPLNGKYVIKYLEDLGDKQSEHEQFSSSKLLYSHSVYCKETKSSQANLKI